MNFPTPLWAKTADAISSTILDFRDASSNRKYALNVDGALAANTITFNNVGADGTTMTVASFPNTSTAMTMSSTMTTIVIDFPCHLQLVKPMTTNPITIIVRS